jgi:predicted ATPase
MYLAMMAEAYKIADQIKEGLMVVAEALALADQSGEHFFEAELYRIKGELLMQVEATAEEEIEQCFRQAIEIAHSQSAKSLALRAVMSLSRFWQSRGLQGQKKEAEQMLAEIYNWFTEGFDTPDLQEAKSLLEALSYRFETGR